MQWFNHHTHSTFCDGSKPPVDYVKTALELGFSVLGFSSHAPLPFDNTFALRDEKVEEYRQTIRSLSYEYAGQLEIHLSMEIDFIPGLMEDFSYWKKRANLDYVIGGVHLLVPPGTRELWFIDGPRRETYDQGLKKFFGGDTRKAVRTYYDQLNQMVESQAPDVIAHIDKIKMHNNERFFSVNDNWYLDMFFENLALVKKKGCIVEVNTRGLYKGRCNELFPNLTALKRIKELQIPVTLSSDAHAPEDLSKEFPYALELIKTAGIKELMVFSCGKWKAEAIQ
ncbi:MAG: histidinol-phosphatase [Bacteroidales bacterium]|nr:histidinol-phosphatase [Bacteroidales bacterium]